MKTTPADKAFSLYIRTRDKWTCQRCGGRYAPPTQALHCAHFKGRAKNGTRLEPLNADALCYGCHQYFHGQPDEHYKWKVDQLGQATVDKIILAANTYHGKIDIKLETQYWKQELKKLIDWNKKYT